MQAPPGAPGTARQRPTRTIMLVNSGGKATQPRAPGHGRPLAAQRAARHGRLSADSGAPGADVPLATTARAPGQHCLSAALLRAPGPDVPLAVTARAPGQDRLRAAPSATAPSPAGVRRLHQGGLPRVPANPRIPIYSYSYHTVSSLRRKPQSTDRPAAGRRLPPSPRACSGGGLGRRPLTTRQVYPAIQVPPRPRSCSPADAGFPLQRHPRAPPLAVRRKPTLLRS